jgi:hypothetical protein
VRVTSKCNLGDAAAPEIELILRRSIEASLRRLRLDRLDLFFLHSNVVPDAAHIASRPGAAARMTPYATFVDHVRPAFERLVAEGVIGGWGLTGIGHPDTIIRLIGEEPILVRLRRQLKPGGRGGWLFRRQAKRLAARAGTYSVSRTGLNSHFPCLRLRVWRNFDASVPLNGSPTWGSTPFAQTCRQRLGAIIRGIHMWY